MMDVIDTNLVYVNRKVPPIKMEQKDDKHLEQNFIAEPNGMGDIEGYNE